MNNFRTGKGEINPDLSGENIMTKLKYGNTNTYFANGLLIDTDYTGTLSAFYKEIKKNKISFTDIKYIIATHYYPDHIRLVRELMELGVKLLLTEYQAEYVHYSDAIFYRQLLLKYNPIDENKAVIISCEQSRDFFCKMGIQGEIVLTVSHSEDGVAVILDDGNCFVGDLEPVEFIGAYESNQDLQKDWKLIFSYNPVIIHYGHANEKRLE